MIVRLRVSKVEQVVCNNYTLQVEPKAFEAMLREIPAETLQPILQNLYGNGQ